MEEIWKQIKDYPEYQISNTGFLRSLRYNKEKYLKIHVDVNGYRWVGLYNNGRKKKRISRLVAEAFLPNPENLRTVDHIDRNRANDHVSNLRWASDKTQVENRNYIPHKGEKIHNSMWTKEQVLEIKKLNRQGMGKRKIAKLYNCSVTQAQSAITNWQHLNCFLES
jgi:hypothetical protein